MFYSDINFRSLLYDVLETVMIQKALQLTILFQLLNDSPSRSFDSMNNQSTVKPPVCSLQLRLRVLPESSWSAVVSLQGNGPLDITNRLQQSVNCHTATSKMTSGVCQIKMVKVQWLLQEDLQKYNMERYHSTMCLILSVALESSRMRAVKSSANLQ